MTNPLRPQPMSPEAIADLVERTRKNSRAAVLRSLEIANRTIQQRTAAAREWRIHRRSGR